MSHRMGQATIDELTLAGSKNADGVRVLTLDQYGKVLDCTGTSAAPNAKAGYAVGCLYRRTDTPAAFINVGTTASCNFREFGVYADDTNGKTYTLGASSGAAVFVEV